jgi:Zinc-binding domain of primase-helicase
MSKNKAASAATISERAVANIAKPNDGERFSRRKYFDEILFDKYMRGSDFFTSNKFISGSMSAAVKLVALAISHYANGTRNATYTDPLTIAKALGIKHEIVIAAIEILRAHEHLAVRKRRDGMTDLVPVLLGNDDVEFGAMKSAKCSTAFYKQRAKLIERILFDRRLTAGQRVVMLGIAATTEPNTGRCEAGQSLVAKSVHVGRRTAQDAVPKLAELGYVVRIEPEKGRPEALAVPELAGSDLGSDLGSADETSSDSINVTIVNSMNSRDSTVITDQEEDIGRELVIRGRRPRTSDAAHGRWRQILPSFGIPYSALDGKHHPCPACGGKDRFRFTDRHGDGDYYCSGCDPGKGIGLVAKVNGWSYAEAAKCVDGLIGNEPRRSNQSTKLAA